MELKKVIDRVYWLLDKKRTLVTLSAYGDHSVYGEKIFKFNDKIYREWVPYRSKLAAAFYKGLNSVDIKDSYTVLYLGASSGTTVSHVSDIIGTMGQVYAVEIAEEMAVNLVILAKQRKNIFPIVGDARKPEIYLKSVPKCDVLYQDVAQRDQTDIFLKNADIFLKKGKIGIFAVKARSIDVTVDSRDIIRAEIQRLKDKFDVLATINLYPYQRDHSLVILRKK